MIGKRHATQLRVTGYARPEAIAHVGCGLDLQNMLKVVL